RFSFNGQTEGVSRGRSRRVDARHEWLGSAGLPPTRLTRDADYFHYRARRSIGAPECARRRSFRLPRKTVRGRSSPTANSQGSYGIGVGHSSSFLPLYFRSEERRVGKECRFRWWTYYVEGK